MRFSQRSVIRIGHQYYSKSKVILWRDSAKDWYNIRIFGVMKKILFI